MIPSYLRVSDEVRTAQREGRAIVALESSVWCQGLPQPLGLEAAREAEGIIRRAGAVPAILAMRDGFCQIGLEPQDLEDMCSNPGVIKVSLRDIPIALALSQWGATTVSASLALCRAAGIPIFSTGGIGGVHRNSTWDVSTDLAALGSHPVMVFCSGAKSLLDIPATLERLETEGVPVVGYRTDSFPVFYTRHSPHEVTVRVDSEDEVVRILRVVQQVHWKRAVLVAQPVPAADELQAHEVEAWLEQAHQAAALAGAVGKRLTPYVLSFLHDKTGGRSLQANCSLLRENAGLAARVAALAAAQDSPLV